MRTGASQTEVKGNAHLIDEHDRENGLIDVFGFAAGEKEKEREREKTGRSGRTSGSTCGQNWGRL